MKYICILRGINVGGKNKVLMSDLKQIFTNLGYFNVQTYIQSGNVIFETVAEYSLEEIELQINKDIFETLELDIPVIIRESNEFAEIFFNNPFLTDSTIHSSNLHVTFLSSTPGLDLKHGIKAKESGSDSFFLVSKNVYIHCSGKYSDSKLTNQFFEKALKVRATTRNWNTVEKLYKMTLL